MIIAIDFDGILCINEFPEIGEPNYQVITLVRELLDAGHEVVLWTSRTGGELIKAVKWCEEYGLHFTNINENAPSNIEKYKSKYPDGTRKVYADLYIEDHTPEFLIACINKGYNYAIDYICKTTRKAVRLWQES